MNYLLRVIVIYPEYLQLGDRNQQSIDGLREGEVRDGLSLVSYGLYLKNPMIGFYGASF